MVQTQYHVPFFMRQSYNGSLSQPSKLMTRVRLPSAALKAPVNRVLFFALAAFLVGACFLVSSPNGFLPILILSCWTCFGIHVSAFVDSEASSEWCFSRQPAVFVGSPDRTLKKKARLFFKNDFTCARIISVGTSLLFNRCGAFSAR